MCKEIIGTVLFYDFPNKEYEGIKLKQGEVEEV